MNKKKIIIVLGIIIGLLGATVAYLRTGDIQESVNIMQNTIANAIEENASTTEIPEAYIEDEQRLEVQEINTEAEGFELQGEIAYESGQDNIPNVQVGGYKGLTYYSQLDSRWKNNLYTSTGDATQTIGSSGCGPTSAAMAISSIKGIITPDKVSDLFVEYGYRSANNGTYWSAFRWVADTFDIKYQETYYLDTVVKLLKNNNIVVAAVGNGLFTTGGHFIVIYGIEGDILKIYDPYLYSGKFNTSTRRNKVIVEGNTIYCSINNFREYANYSIFFAYQNTHAEETKQKQPVVKLATYTRYVKVNTSLNVRSGPGTNYSVIKSLYNTNKVTVYEVKGVWARIGENIWVSSDYLTDSNIVSTVGQYRKFAKTYTYIYSNSDLSGIRYTYLAKTQVRILENVSSSVDKIYVPATGRYGYVLTSVYQ